MAVWRIINRSYLKHASSRFTRSYSQASLASPVKYAAKRSRIRSSSNPNSDFCRNPYSAVENVRFFASSALARLKKEDIETDGPRLNERITAPVVRLVTEDGHCVVSKSEALRRAKEKEQDLVEVQKDANPPVCKIMDYKREKYVRATKEKERAKAKRSETTLRPGIKEVQFSPKIELKDLKFKADQAMRMMERGYRVKCMAVPEKNRDIEPEKLAELLSRFTPFIEDSVVESGPSMEKKQAFVVVRHSKFGDSKKGGSKKVKDIDIKTAIKIPSPKEDSAKDGKGEAEEKEIANADSGQAFDSEPGSNANESQPVKIDNRYAKREPSNQFSAGRPTDNRGPDGRDANRYGPQSPNQQHSQPRFPNQAPNQQATGFQPRPPNQPLNPQHSHPRFPGQAPNQQHSGFQPRSPYQPPNQRPSQPGPPNRAPTGPGRSSGPASGYGIFSNPNKNEK